MKNFVKSALTLGLITFISAFFLSHVMKITYPSILKQEMEKQKKALSMVLPGYKVGEKKNTKIDGKNIVYWVGEKQDGDKVEKGLAYITYKPGYSGDVKSMVGVNQKGIILGISILDQLETPGLGARCIEIASKLTFFGFLFGEKVADEITTPWFQDQYKGINLRKKIKILKMGDWKPEIKEALLKQNAISAITGATITSRTVTRSLEVGVGLLDNIVK